MADFNLSQGLAGLAGGAADFVLFDAETERLKILERMRQKGATERTRLSGQSAEDVANIRNRGGLRRQQAADEAAFARQTAGDKAALERTQLQVEGRQRSARLQRQVQAAKDVRSTELAGEKEKRLKDAALAKLAAQIHGGNFDPETQTWTVEDQRRGTAIEDWQLASRIDSENKGLSPAEALGIARMMRGDTTMRESLMTARARRLWRERYSQEATTTPTEPTARTEVPTDPSVSPMEAVKDLLGF